MKASPVKRVWGPWPTAGLGLAAEAASFVVGILVIVVFTVVEIVANPGLPAVELESSASSTEGLMVSVSTILGGIAGVSLILKFVRLRKGISVSEYLGLKRIGLKTALTWLGIMVALIVLSDGLSYLLGRPLNSQSNIATYMTSVWPPLLWVAVIVFAPAYEETQFRGFVFEGFRQSRIGPLVTIVLMSLVWTSLHIGEDFFALTSIFVGGIALGVARLKTGSLWTPMLMHGFANLVATLEIVLNANSLVR